ncbi:Vitamin K-dependent protein C [Merluccius polli]|uniref:Vitamin K-dependent protein C n=1 Tax=Merluccius polli TaxID=89951 RepID=A0AA47PAG1_MERPO|nr:Vitamin K-dependent protein C [Merluccius polli]
MVSGDTQKNGRGTAGGAKTVFSSGPEAHAVLRSKRANSWLEELKPASLERECMEEVCDYEEAREIFHTREATVRELCNGNQCSSHKCVNGVCVDGFQAYECSCNPGYEGKYCNQPRTATNCSEDNGKCHHECTENAGGTARTCSCVGGYRLHDDGKSCIPTGRSSCGQLLIARSSYSGPIQGLQPWVMGGEVGKKGESPWQVLLLNNRGEFHCGGVLINENWVLTAAHCLKNILHFSVRLGDYERFKVEGTEVTLAVVHFVGHPAYNPNTADNDIALMRLATPAPTSNYIAPACLPPRALAERVLHLNGTVTVVTGWGKDRQGDEAHFSSALNVIKVPLVERAMCVQHMEVNVTENMLCAGALGSDADACDGDSGGPMVTRYRDTWFLLGLVSWGEGCGRPDKLGVYTKVANYNGWIEGVQQDWDRKHRPQV